ncbi:hypothetical protein H0H93_000577, partial [Arthromyces matolae]
TISRKSPGLMNRVRSVGLIGSILVLMSQHEDYQMPANNDTHGHDRPIVISNGGSITACAQDFLRASDAIGVLIWTPLTPLKYGPSTSTGTQAQLLVRSDPATACIHTVLNVQSNLYLRTNARVSRVIFEGTKAVGVAYVPSRDRVHNAQVKETIVRAWNKNVVQPLDINVVSDFDWRWIDGIPCFERILPFSLDDFLRGEKEVQKEIFSEWEASPDKARTEDELKEMSPEFNELWKISC